MLARLKPWLPILKLLLLVAILAGVGWLFARTLQSEELQATDRSRSPGAILWHHIEDARWSDLVACGLLYLAGLAFSLFFWLALLSWVGSPLPLLTATRIYYISHLGKYAFVGKGWALLMRTAGSTAAGIRAGVAALTATYETLTMMASGALLAAVVLVVIGGDDRSRLWAALGLLALAGIPIVPGVFNALVGRLSARFGPAALLLPRLGTGALLTGLALTACGWALQGASLASLLHGMEPSPPPFDLVTPLRLTAYVAISYVAGFLSSTPGGLGVREICLQHFLAPETGAATAVVAVILLRLIWTIAELLIAGVLYWIPTRPALEGSSP
jgi:uncharacterized membrane protein YbhN (UPF0104 family)